MFDCSNDPSSLINNYIENIFKEMVRSKINDGFLFYHNGKNYDFIILLNYLDFNKFSLKKDV